MTVSPPEPPFPPFSPTVSPAASPATPPAPATPPGSASVVPFPARPFPPAAAGVPPAAPPPPLFPGPPPLGGPGRRAAAAKRAAPAKGTGHVWFQEARNILSSLGPALGFALRPLLPDRAQWQAALSGEWLLSLAWALACCLLVWFGGPWFGALGVYPLASSGARMLFVLLILGVWSLHQRLRQVEEQESSRRLMASLMDAAVAVMDPAREAPPPSAPASRAFAEAPGPAGTAPGVEAFRDREEDAAPVDDARLLAAAGAEIRRVRRQFAESLARSGPGFGERLLHRLPWYLVIGAPGAGKTTLLGRCAPSHPESPPVGPLALAELAGTRGCDWWFSRDAVLIDTAGRYTAQTSDPEVDRAAWQGLLDLVQEYRPRQPLNGVVVVVSVADLLLGSDAQRQYVADSLAQRLAELDQRFTGPLPVYVVLTMADRIAGFTEYFAALPPRERRRPWGVRLPLPAALLGPGGTEAEGLGAGGPALTLGPRLDAFAAALTPGLGRRLAHLSPALRLRALGFPQQMARLAPYLEALVASVMVPAGGETGEARHLVLRGLWFTSARREGPALDLLAADQHAAFGLPPLAEDPVPREEALFTAGLLTEAMLPEAWIAGQDTLSRARQRRHRRSLMALAAGTAVMVLWWSLGWQANHGMLNAALSEGERLAPVLARTAGGGEGSAPITDGEVSTVLPLLDRLRSLPEGRDLRADPLLGRWAGGLGQGLKIEGGVESLYRRGLHRLLLPRMVRRLEESVALPPEADDRMFEALKIYLMLTGVAPVDRYTVLRWFVREDEAMARDASLRRSMADHVAALFDGGYAPYSPTLPLVEQARHKLVGWSQADRGWRLLQGLPGLEALPGWRPAERLGPAAGLVFTRPSGRSLMEPVPGLFTAAGWELAVRPALARVAMEMTLEGWVLGLPMDRLTMAGRARQIYQELASRYFEAFAARWEQLLADIAVVPLTSTPQALVVVGALTGPDAPWRTALAAIERETGFARQAARPPQAPVPETDPAAVLAQALDGGTLPPAAGILLRRFQPLHRLHGAEGMSDAVLLGVLGSLEQLRVQLGRRLAGAPPLPGETPAATAAQVKTLAAGLPAPLERWFTSVADSSARLLMGGGGGP